MKNQTIKSINHQHDPILKNGVKTPYESLKNYSAMCASRLKRIAIDNINKKIKKISKWNV